MKRLNLTQYRKQIQEIRSAQEAKSYIPNVFISVEEDGSITTGHGNRQQRFETLFDVEAHLLTVPGITSKTKFFVEDFILIPDGEYQNGVCLNGPYLPAEPLLYYAGAEERKAYIDRSNANDVMGWMALYVALVKNLLARSISDPSIGETISTIDDPALKDLIENYSNFTLAELVERYRDRRWFRGYL